MAPGGLLPSAGGRERPFTKCETGRPEAWSPTVRCNFESWRQEVPDIPEHQLCGRSTCRAAPRSTERRLVGSPATLGRHLLA